MGSAHPRLARAVLAELREIAGERGIDEDGLWDALYGLHDDPEINGLFADLDRCALRIWSLPDSPGCDFGESSLPQGETTARCLRAAMGEVAHSRGNLTSHELEWLQKFAVADLSGSHQIPDALALCNEALLGDLEHAPLVYWHVYSSAAKAERLYRLSVSRTEP